MTNQSLVNMQLRILTYTNISSPNPYFLHIIINIYHILRWKIHL